jgi:ComF family protein
MGILHDLLNIIFPKICLICTREVEENQQMICFYCLSDLPLTDFSEHSENRLETSFSGRIPIRSATSLVYFHKKGQVQKLMHQLKYHDKQEIGRFFGNWLGEEMLRGKRFEQVDVIVPVPLHPQKQKKRGYNQVTTFAEQLAIKLEAELRPELLIKTSVSKTQTLKNRKERSLNKENEFKLTDNNFLENKHLLLVDDIITSGATLEACWVPLRKVQGIRISLASMALTV